MEFDKFTTLKRGRDLTRDAFRDGMVPVAGSNGVIGFHDTANVIGPGITVGRSGSVGRVTYYDQDFWAHNTALFVTDFHGNDPRFAAYLLESLRLGRFSSGASVPTLDRNVFRTLPVTVPPVPEQKKIAHILSTVQRAIEEQERIIQTTTELKRALMQKLFTEGLRGEPQKETEIGLVPESWEVVAVEDIAEVKGGKRLPKGEKLVAEDTGLPYIRVTDFSDSSVDTRDLRFLTEGVQKQISRYIIKKEDVFISIAGSIGITGMIPENLDGANLTENAARLIAKDAKQLLPRYLMFWLASDHCQGEISAQTVKNAQPKLALTRIKSLHIPLPSFEEQNEIAGKFDLVGKKISNAQKKKTSLQDLFGTLLHELMTAKICVHELKCSEQRGTV